jgi:hypothetical protein
MQSLFAGLMIHAAIQAAHVPLPPEWRDLTDHLPSAQVDQLWARSQRFCAAQTEDDPGFCRAVQLGALGSISSAMWQLGLEHSDRAAISFAVESCGRMYRQNNTGDARILDHCLARSLGLASYSDQEARANGADRSLWTGGVEHLEIGNGP